MMKFIPINAVEPLQVTNASITIFEGQPVHLECYPDPILAQIRWTFNDNDIHEDNERISLQPDELHHQLFIRDPIAADSGIYICYVDTDVGRLTFINTTLTVIPGMRYVVTITSCVYVCYGKVTLRDHDNLKVCFVMDKINLYLQSLPLRSYIETKVTFTFKVISEIIN